MKNILLLYAYILNKKKKLFSDYVWNLLKQEKLEMICQARMVFTGLKDNLPYNAYKFELFKMQRTLQYESHIWADSKALQLTL